MVVCVTGGQPLALQVSGDVGGTDIGVFCDRLAALVDRGGEVVLIDLSGLSSWSLVAQAMVLRTARRLRTEGRRLVLVAPGADLVDRSSRLDVFGLIETVAMAPSLCSRFAPTGMGVVLGSSRTGPLGKRSGARSTKGGRCR
jgi:anti-anti-sigma regulatory factor